MYKYNFLYTYLYFYIFVCISIYLYILCQWQFLEGPKLDNNNVTINLQLSYSKYYNPYISSTDVYGGGVYSGGIRVVSLSTVGISVESTATEDNWYFITIGK